MVCLARWSNEIGCAQFYLKPNLLSPLFSSELRVATTLHCMYQ